MQSLDFFIENTELTITGSGETSETVTAITTTSISTIIFTTNDETTVTTGTSISSITNTSTTTDDTSMDTTTTAPTDTTAITTDATATAPTAATVITTGATTTENYFSCESKRCTGSQVEWIDCKCVEKSIAQSDSLEILRNNASDANDFLKALLVYFRSTDNLTVNSNDKSYLTPSEVDSIIKRLVETNQNSSDAFIAISRVTNDDPVLGGLSLEKHGLSVLNSTKDTINNTDVKAGIIISNPSSINHTFVRVFIPYTYKHYRYLDVSNNQRVVSRVVVFDVEKKTNVNVDVSLYFQNLDSETSDDTGDYFCSFFHPNTSKWDTSNCSRAKFDPILKRYQCNCTHLSTFALIWQPNLTKSKYLTSLDIASLIFQSISIVCFILVIIHSSTIRVLNPLLSINARDLLPLISSASTTILFIFYIALTMTVYTQTTSEKEKKCFLSSSVLMFFVYFLLIFMFCVKTSVGYFNYCRFVRLFPEPSSRKLVALLIISFFISITSTSLAIGLNSNASYNVTMLYPYKLCWFTQDAINYFMIIPIGTCLLLNFITITLVVRRIINHVRFATSPHQSYERMKQCVLVLLSSCIAQGIGWILGPIIALSVPEAGIILGWFFIILNGLEGFWTICLYIIIRLKHMDEPRRISGSKKYIEQSSSKPVTDKQKKKSNSFSRKKIEDTDRYTPRRRSSYVVLDDIDIKDEDGCSTQV